jgi:hypothetical protein
LELRDEIDAIESAAKEQTAVLRAKMDKIETYFLALAEQDGLKNIPTNSGLVYFGSRDNASVADPEAFLQFIKDNDAWDLIERRASAKAVRSYIETEGGVPTGVNFSTRRTVTVRRGK